MSDAIKDLIRRKAEAAGIDPTHALTMASIESSFNPTAVSPTGYKGLFQFGDAEWKAHGGGKDIFDPEANTDAFVSYHKEIQDKLKSALGRDPTPQEMYLGWQQGAAGAPKLINANPDDKAAGTVAVPNILANGGTADMTNRDFVNLWNNRYGEHNAALTGSQFVKAVPPPAMQAADPQSVSVAAVDPAAVAATGGKPVPGLLDRTKAAASNVATQAAGLLSAGASTAIPGPGPLPGMPGLLSPRVPNPNAVAMLPKLKSRGLLG